MGVLACNRRDCESIMCDRLILGGEEYICEKCWTELLAYKATWKDYMMAAEVRSLIEDFMDSVPGTHITCKTDQEFQRLTE